MDSRASKLRLAFAALALACLAALAFAAATRTTAQSPPTKTLAPHVADELLVKFGGNAPPENLSATHARLGARVVESLAPAGWQRVKLPKSLSVEDAIKIYAETPGVAGAQPNYVYHIDNTPNDPRFNELYAMTKIAAPTAWDTTTGSGAVVVAVLDTGVRYTHEDLAANVWTNPGETGTDAQGHDKATNGVDDDGDGFADDVHGYDFDHGDPDPDDDNGHGTHCAGTIGAVGNNSLGVVGVNWQVRLLAVKTHDSAGNSTSAKVVAAFGYVTMLKSRGVNVRVTSNSWGGAPEAPAYDQALVDALNTAADADILNVFAAGNANTDTDTTPSYPASYNVSNLISVAASDQNDNRASFSNYGATTVDLAAPGVNILSTSKNAAPSNYVTLSGTSMATPHVAGAAALVAASNPALSAASLKASLLNGVDVLANWTNDPAHGRLTLTGGRLNVARAVSSPTACSYTLSQPGASFGAQGGNSAFNVNTQANCDWDARSNDSWITVTNVTRQADGFGFVNFTVAQWQGSPRTGTITAAGQTFTVTQTLGCTFTITPASLPTFPAAGGQGTITITTNAGCSWTASSLAPWITITSGAGGTGTGAINFNVAPNPDKTPRSGQILHTDDSFYTINQSGVPALPGEVLISEFRIDGPAGAADEFYELYNATDQMITVKPYDNSAGWSVMGWFSSGGLSFTRFLCTIPAGATIPARGHYLCANNFTDNTGTPRGYSLADYGGSGRAAPDQATTGAGASADGVNTVFAGLALFTSTLSFSTNDRLDAVGTASVGGFGGSITSQGQPINYRGEYNDTSSQYSWVRRLRDGAPVNTHDSASDFVLVSTRGSVLGGVQSVLGAPSPENSASPVARAGAFPSSPVDPKCATAVASAKLGCQNAARDTADTGANRTFGTLAVRRRFTNATGASVTALRFRVVDITTLGSPPTTSAHADLRVLSSPDVTVTTRDGRQITLRGATLEQPPVQPTGGGLNSSLALDLTSSPLAPGDTVDVQFLLGVEREGKFRFVVFVEAP